MSAHDTMYGRWSSPFSPSSLATSSSIYDIQWDSDGQTVVWVESRAGHSVLLGIEPNSADAPRILTPEELTVRGGVGYGGGEFTVHRGVLYFAERNGRLYRQSLSGGDAHPVTPGFGSAAAPAVSPDGKWVLFVHTYEDTDVVALVSSGGRQWPQRLISGHDFYMQPCWNPAPTADTYQIAYIGWNHPQMPWDGTQLYLATLAANEHRMPTLRDVQILAGNDDTALFQPAFSPDGRWLAYVSDVGGWGQIYLYNLQSGETRQLTQEQAEHGTPAWVQGLRTYGWSHDSQSIRFIRNREGTHTLYLQAITATDAEPITGLEPYQVFGQPALAPNNDALAVVATAPKQPPRLLIHPATNTAAPPAVRIVQRTRSERIQLEQLAQAQPVSWQAAQGHTVHGILYLPPGLTTEQLAAAPTLPPAIIRIHGGPTSQASLSYSSDTQFYATRGYIVLHVNYRGSTGYGRAYMQQLRGAWGVADVEDAVSAADYLATHKLANPDQLVILGGSAGGYTVLEALCQSPGRFKAGICLYGVANLFTLVADTHKFEARYLDGLVGKLPDDSALYRERSPVFHANLIQDPVAVFQGSDDKVVPPSQSEAIVAALRRSGVPHEYHLYEGEGHGWRKPETIEKFYRTVDAFLQQYVLYD